MAVIGSGNFDVQPNGPGIWLYTQISNEPKKVEKEKKEMVLELVQRFATNVIPASILRREASRVSASIKD